MHKKRTYRRLCAYCRDITAAVMLVAGIGLLGLGIWQWYQATLSSERYEELARSFEEEPTAHQDQGAGTASPQSYTSSVSFDDELVAWIKVGGTPIDLPVASGSHGLTWYLHHDLWGNASELGCPFLDPRCPSPENSHVLVYGHHISLGNAMFSPLHKCYEQGQFDCLSQSTWTTASGNTPLQPLCALRVDQDDPDIIRFSFGDEGEFRAWVLDITRKATAKVADAEQLAVRATRVITLVTCSSEIAGQRWRTLVLFSC